MITRKIAALSLCAFAFAAVAPAFAANEKGKGIIGARQHMMSGVAGNLNAIKSILTEDPGQIALVPDLANMIAAASPTIPAYFPEGVTDDTTTALPAIWEQPAEFESASLKLEELALALAETAEGGDPQATMAAFGTMGKEGCGGCHEDFRQKKE